MDPKAQQRYPFLPNLRNLSSTDEQFVGNVNKDIKRFLKKGSRTCVLIFPPVSSFHRFLIHQTCESVCQDGQLCTFSVGQGIHRRTVICFRSQLLDPSKIANQTAQTNTEIRYQKPVENWRSMNVASSSSKAKILNERWTSGSSRMGVGNKINDNRGAKTYSMDSQRLTSRNDFVENASAANVAMENSNPLTHSTATATVASMRRSTMDSIARVTTTSISCNNSPRHANENEGFRKTVTSNNMSIGTLPENSFVDSAAAQEAEAAEAAAAAVVSAPATETETENAMVSSTSGTQQSKTQIARRERRPDRAVYIPRARRSQTTPPTTAAATIATTTNTATTMTTTTAPAPATTNDTTSGIAVSAIAIATTTTAAAAANSTIGSSNSSGSGGGLSHQKTNSINLTANISGPVSTTSLSKADDSTKKKFRAHHSSIGGGSGHNNNNIGSSAVVGNKERRLERHRKSSGTITTTATTTPSQTARRKEEVKDFNCKNRTNSQDCDRKQQTQLVNQQNENISSERVAVGGNNYQNPRENCYKLTSPNLKIVCATEIFNNPSTKETMIASKKQQKSPKSPKSPLSASFQNGFDNTNSTIQQQQQQQHHQSPISKVPSKLLIEELVSNGQRQTNRHGGIGVGVNTTAASKCDIEEQELQRASKEINRSNRRIMKQTFVSDVLEIPDKIVPEPHMVSPKMKFASAPPPSQTFDSTTEDEEDDWESKFDESGECLDPKIMEELESAVGKVKITKPKSDYSSYLTNQAILNDEEFPHVLEVSNFPMEFKNQDLLMVFSQYKESGFDIKWVDDTHALAVFSSSRIAAEVLTMGHPFVVLKPLADATLESRLKAKKCAASLQPYRQRPETCAALARRLVTGALGVRLETAAAERENEKRVLRKAKERKLLAAKQRDEAWES